MRSFIMPALSREPVRISMIRNVTVLILISAVLAGIWAWSNISHSISFYSASCDYPSLSMAHGINVDMWFSGIAPKQVDNSKIKSLNFSLKPSDALLDRIAIIDAWLPGGKSRNVGYFQTMHPGIPLQVAGWLAYRLSSTALTTTALERAETALKEPSHFWLLNRMLALIITLMTLVIIYKWNMAYGVIYAIAGSLVFFSYMPTWTFTITQLGNETFALPLAAALFFLAGRALARDEGVARYYYFVGIMCGLSYLNKLNYIAWAAAVCCGMIVARMMRCPSAKQMLVNSASLGAGFASSIFIVGGLWLGVRGLLMMLYLHTKTILHTGSYGSGESGLVNLSSALTAVTSLVTQSYLFLLLACVIITIVIVAASQKRYDIEWRNREIPYLACLVSGFLLCLASTLKHYSSHYFISGAALLPMMILFLGPQLLQRARVVVISGVCIAVLVSCAQFLKGQAEAYAAAKAYEKEIGAIKALPLGAQDVRLWSYHVNSPEYITHFIDSMVGRPDLHKVVENLWSQDLHSNIWAGWSVNVSDQWVPIENTAWRYAILDKTYAPLEYPLGEHLQNNARVIFDGAGTIVLERVKK